VLEDPLVAVEFDEQFSFSELDNQIYPFIELETRYSALTG